MWGCCIKEIPKWSKNIERERLDVKSREKDGGGKFKTRGEWKKLRK